MRLGVLFPSEGWNNVSGGRDGMDKRRFLGMVRLDG
jgi:hypothetical protein